MIEKLKKITSKKIRIFVFLGLFITGILLPLIATLTKTFADWLQKDCNMWTRFIFDNNDNDTVVSRVCLILFVINVIMNVVCYAIDIFKKKKTIVLALVVSAAFSIVTISLANSVSTEHILSAGGVVALVFNVILSLVGSAYYVIHLIVNKDELKNNNIKEEKEIIEENEKEGKPTRKANIKVSKFIALGTSILSEIVIFIMMFIPLYTTTNAEGDTVSFTPISAIKDLSMDALPNFIAFVSLFLVLVISISYILSVLPYIKDYPRYFIKKTKKIIYVNFVLSVIYFLLGLVITFINQIDGKESSTISFIPFLVSSIIMIIFAILSAIWVEAEEPKEDKNLWLKRLEMLIYVVLFTAISGISLFFKILKVTYNGEEQISIVGFNVIRDYKNLPVSSQLLAFFMYAMILIIASLVVATIVSFFKNKKLFFKFACGSILANILFIFTTGLFGIYYQIVQAMNTENLQKIFAAYGFEYTTPEDYKIKSETIFAFFISMALLVFVILRNPLKNAEEIEKEPLFEGVNGQKLTEKEEIVEEGNTFDACPAFSELDNKIPEFEEAKANRISKEFDAPTLPSVVSFVVDYARDSRLHLSYTTEDIATFVAGLGATRLSILQGMSGTGKTSLPKIFLEALMGNCEIVEVESSWRDKNELLGYYNEFSKTFTPKKFTQALYKAKLNEGAITFIVLDEMNLSRIEYYFSDFLSLMENEEDKRQIKLLNVKLYNEINGVKKSYSGLFEDHTIKIPTNVWFIGTANRDESTFEISDKVYDRAHTMNFNKRAPKVSTTNAPMDQRYVSYETLINLINEAKTTYQFDIDQSPIVKKVEEILAPYNISFGNRISKQIEEFVKVYCSCFNNKENAEEEALETILLSKVVAKLETKSVENKELLIAEFNKLKLSRCAEFVSKLNED